MKGLIKKSTRDLYYPWSNFLDIGSFFPSGWGDRLSPSVNIYEDEKNYYLDLAAPGLEKDNFDISVSDDLLTISSETNTVSSNADDDKQYRLKEYNYSSFSRSFNLPDNTKDDAITASYENGVLKLVLPKTEHPVKATKKINIH